jgi:hypothetical protein
MTIDRMNNMGLCARLMALNNSDKNLATFLSANERVGLDEDQTCVDPIRPYFTLTLIHRMRNGPLPMRPQLSHGAT